MAGAARLIGRFGGKDPSSDGEPPETILESDLRESIEIARANKIQIQPPNTNGAGKEHDSELNGGGKPSAPVSGTAPATKLEHALKTAISAAQNAEALWSRVRLRCAFRCGRNQVDGDHGAHQHERREPPMSMVEAAPVLSPTQVRCFMDCHARWWFKYDLRVPDPPNGNLALGRCGAFRARPELRPEGRDLRGPSCLGGPRVFRDDWALECEQAEFRDDEDPAQLVFAGEALVSKYLDEVAPAVEPAAVELRVEGVIGGVQVQGFIDVLDAEGRIIDIKTAKASPSSIEPMNRFQIATYRQFAPDARGKGRIDTLVKTRTPKIVLQSFDITEGDVRATQSIYAAASQAMQSEIYMPNRQSMFCSRRNCAYWRDCEREWGGEVPES